MVLDDIVDTRKIITSSGMSARPEFYSARGATTTDLNSNKLETIYQSVKREVGQDAANNFLYMVLDMEKLSATDFLLSFYALGSNDWKWEQELASKEKGLYVTNETTGFGTIAGVLLGDNDKDESDAIVGEFFKRHGVNSLTLRQNYGFVENDN